MSDFLGITVMSPYIQNEGIDGVLRSLELVGATAVAVNTSVTAPCADGEGFFMPPIDAGASPRVFDRPLWGKTSLWARGGAAFKSNESFYDGCVYRPRQPNDLTDSDGHIIGDFIREAKSAGLRVYIQMGAAQPPGMLEQDVPRLPNLEIPQDRLASTASLASEDMRAYNRAFLRDVFEAYPEIDGIRPDWPEYPCYKLCEAFQDFGSHVERWADERGFDFQKIRQQVARFYDYLHGELKNSDLEDFASPDRGKYSLLHRMGLHPEIADWFRLKAELSQDLLSDFRVAITRFGGAEKELSANAFMPPFTFVTGLDFARAADVCESIAPKLYTMHWSLIVKFWGDELLAANTGLDEGLLVKSLVNLLDLADGESGSRISDYGYPGPDEAHPIPNEPQRRKIRQAVSAAGGKAAILPLVHGYGPLKDYERRFRLVAESDADGIWVNRYGYLSDEKLESTKRIWTECRQGKRT